MFFLQEIILKRAADLAEALYSMPRTQQLAIPAPRSPSHHLNHAAHYTGYASQLDSSGTGLASSDNKVRQKHNLIEFISNDCIIDWRQIFSV